MMFVLRFLCTFAVFGSVLNARDVGEVESRSRGLILGSLIGDAAGGPVEFAETDWEADEWLMQKWSEGVAIEIGERFRLRDYPMKAAPYAQWIDYAPAGTITDDSRHKLVLWESAKDGGQFTREAYVDTTIAYFESESRADRDWRREWLNEYVKRFYWIKRREFGGRLSEGAVAYPPDRVWGGIPTMAGQMPLLPMACLFPGDPERAYLKTWELNILDTGIGMDFTSALVAGLAQALVVEEDWDQVFQSMLNTDPYAYNEVPWVERRFRRWLGRALEIGRGDYESTAVFFSELENRMEAETWWEAHVPMTITFAILEYTDYNPIAAMQLSLEFGRDTDSTAQLMGAFLGAVYGLEIWSEKIREPVERELNVQYGVTVEDLLEVFSGE